MGQDQSSSNSQQASTSSPTNSSTGVSNSFSFLARKRLSTKSSSQIVVVNSSTAQVGDPKEDEELKKIKEIPRFFPILKGVLPAFKDSPEILTKIEPKYIYRFLHRLQFHFSVCSQTVCSEQSSISTQIVEVDQLIGNLSKKMTQTTKKHDHFTAEMKKAELLNQQLDSLQLLFQEIIPGLIFLNELLPDAERLPPLQLPTPSTNLKLESLESSINNLATTANTTKIVPIEEFSVVDKKP